MNIDNMSYVDPQTSIEFDHTRARQSNTATIHLSGLNVSSSIMETIANRVSSIEERLNACDSIYRLATQTNSVRERERREKFQSFISYAQSLDQRISIIEEKVGEIPQLIQNHVHGELKQFDNSQQIELKIKEAQKQITNRISAIEKQFEVVLKKSQKEIKRLKIEAQLAITQPEEDDRIEEVAAQISEMRRRQALMFDLLNAMKSHNLQDFENVNAQLSTLWAQISTKRVDSPIRH
ncbi:hypothetical protein M9Y10_004333 [Tritrichomonas musculus]|uniref:Uncharacterized protein n=1 Tax=Tritrichomonas musculus TaxID=1915356 RepID=A0ABR2JS99_9EUKA